MNSAFDIPVDRSRLLREKLERHLEADEREHALRTLQRLIDNADSDVEHQRWSNALAEMERGPEPFSKPAAAKRRPEKSKPAEKPKQRKAASDKPGRVSSDEERWLEVLRREEWDRAYCVADAMIGLNKAGDAQRAYVAKHRPARWVRPTGRLSYDDWAKLRHPDEDHDLSAVLGLLAAGLHRLLSQKLSLWNLHQRKDHLPPHSQLAIVDAFETSAHALGHDAVPDFYLARDRDLGLKNANVEPTALIIGADMLTERDARELAFRATRLLCKMRPEYVFSSMGYPRGFVELLISVVQHYERGEAELREKFGENAVQLAEELSRLPAPIAEALFRRIAEIDEDVDVERWFHAADHTASRAGLLISGDLEAAVEAIRTDDDDSPVAATEVRIRELIRFSIGAEYVELREQLGVGITMS